MLENLLPSILENFTKIIPVRTVHDYEQAVKFRFGKAVALKKQGMYAFVPFFESYEVRSTVAETINLPNQSIMTSDGVNVTVSGAVEYQIEDLMKWWCGVQDFNQTLINTSLGYLSRGVRKAKFEDIRTDSRPLEEAVADQLGKKIAPWGTYLIDFYITDLVPCRGIRLFTDGTSTDQKGYLT